MTRRFGEKVMNSRELTGAAAKMTVGDKATVTVLRNGKKKSFDVEVGKRPLSPAGVGASKQEKETEYGFQIA